MAYHLSKRPTPEEWQIVAWMFIVVLAGLGSVGLWYAFQAPQDKADIARQVMWIGIASWLLAMFTWGFKRGVEHFVG
jgi:hypothetical protein